MSYKERDKSIPAIAKELGVSHILESGFQRSGNQIRITLQLIDGPSDDHFWTDEFKGVWE
jgi:TolB-like protein